MINLLPQKEKRVLQNEEKRKIILIIGFLIFIFLLCLIMILISIKFYISGKVLVEEAILDQGKEEMGLPEEDLRNQIKEANDIFSEIYSFYENQFKLTDIINRISGTIPEGIYLTSLSYQPKEGQVNISGFAEEREILFQFKKNLEKEEFKEIFFPPYTWIEAKEINFNSHFKIILDENES